MIRNDIDDIDDETFNNLVRPADEKVRQFVIGTFLYDYIAYYISTFYRHDAMWSCSLEQEINSALASLCNYELENIDYNKLKKLLNDKYQIVIESEKPLKILDTKK